MSEKLYTFLIKGNEYNFYEDYIESKYESFYCIDFYTRYVRAEAKGTKLILFRPNGKKMKYALKGFDIQYLDSICATVNSAIQNRKLNDEKAHTKIDKDPEYKISCGNSVITAYENYATVVDPKGVKKEFFYDDLASFFVSPPYAFVTGDVVIATMDGKNDEKFPFVYKKEDAEKVDCVIKYICQRACEIKNGRYNYNS